MKDKKEIFGTVFMSGPISGAPQARIGRFNAAAERLAELGYTETINPVDLCGGDYSQNWRQYMRLCIKAMIDCDAIYMLPGWRDSKAATLEHHIAMALGLKFVKE